MATPILPKQQSQVVDQTGRATREWYDYLRDILDAVGGEANVAAQIAVLGEALTALEAEVNRDIKIAGDGSVRVNGTVANGTVFISLSNDEAFPGADTYYGTDAAGTKGFYSLTYRGVLPVVTGEAPPVFLYADDGSLIYAPVEA